MRTCIRLTFTAPDGRRHDEEIFPDAATPLQFRVRRQGALALLGPGDEIGDVVLSADIEMTPAEAAVTPMPGIVSTRRFERLRVALVIDPGSPHEPSVQFIPALLSG